MNQPLSWTLGALLAGIAAFAAPAHAAVNLVSNGGFERRDFTGWLETGETAFNGVQCPGAGNALVASGECSAFFGAFSAPGGIQQTIDFGSTGQAWDLSFALQSDGGAPSSFSVLFGGRTLLLLTSPVASDYVTYRFSGVSATQNATLAFNVLSPAGYLSLDDVSVSVSAVPEPGAITLMGAGLVALFLARRRKVG